MTGKVRFLPRGVPGSLQPKLLYMSNEDVGDTSDDWPYSADFRGREVVRFQESD